MEKLSRHLWSMLLFVYSPPTKNSAVDSLCQYTREPAVHIVARHVDSKRIGNFLLKTASMSDLKLVCKSALTIEIVVHREGKHALPGHCMH
jgi:hypothetical protein